MESRREIIVQFIHALTTGGAETLVKDYSIELKRRGYDVRVLVLYSEPDLPNQKLIEEEGIPITAYASNIRNSHNLIKKGIYYIQRQIGIRLFVHKYMREVKPDIVHVHLMLMQYLSCARKELKNCKIFYTCHSTPKAIFAPKSHERRADNRALKWFLRNGNMRIIALHKDMANEINELFGVTNTITLNNPIDLARFQNPGVDKFEYRKKLGIPQNAFVVGHVGRFSKVKNHEFLVKVFTEIIKLKPEAFLLMVGAGELMPQVRSQLDTLGLNGKYIILSDRKDTPQLYATMDAFCLPSLFEGFPLVSLEAQAAGLRCVISDTIPDVVMCTDNICAMNLKQAPREWAQIILAEELPPYTPQKSLTDFDLSHIVNELLGIYFD